jgi:hypothetical protein
LFLIGKCPESADWYDMASKFDSVNDLASMSEMIKGDNS